MHRRVILKVVLGALVSSVAGLGGLASKVGAFARAELPSDFPGRVIGRFLVLDDDAANPQPYVKMPASWLVPAFDGSAAGKSFTFEHLDVANVQPGNSRGVRLYRYSNSEALATTPAEIVTHISGAPVQATLSYLKTSRKNELQVPVLTIKASRVFTDPIIIGPLHSADTGIGSAVEFRNVTGQDCLIYQSRYTSSAAFVDASGWFVTLDIDKLETIDLDIHRILNELTHVDI